MAVRPAVVALFFPLVWVVVSAAAPIERLTATAVDPADPAHAGTVPVEIVIVRWSTDAEQAVLARAADRLDGPALLDRLCDLPVVGAIRTAAAVEYELHFAREIRAADGTRRVVVATDRAASFWAPTYGGRPGAHPFTFVELRIGRDGAGEARTSLEAPVAGGPGEAIGIAAYADRPVRLVSIRSERTSS